MVDRREIRKFVQRVADEFAPDQIVLFGSYATGRPGDDSDVDLLVVMPHKGRNIDQSLEITRRIDRSFPLDLLVRTPSEVRRRLKQGDMFLRSVMQDGKILYAGNRKRVGPQGRR